MGIYHSSPDSDALLFSRDMMVELKRLRRIVNCTAEEAAKLEHLELLKFEYLCRQALRSKERSGCKIDSGLTFVRCLDIVSAEEEAKFYRLVDKHQAAETVSDDEMMFMSYMAKFFTYRYCSIANLRYWDFEGDEHDDASTSDTSDDDANSVGVYDWWELPPLGDTRRRQFK